MPTAPTPESIASPPQPLVLRLFCKAPAYCPACGDTISPDAYFVHFNTVFCGRCGIVETEKVRVCAIALRHPACIAHVASTHNIWLLSPQGSHLANLDVWALLDVLDPSSILRYPYPDTAP